ncbi:helix-turn-helix domain-containing protein [Pseudooceanicola sp. HF7]|nr:helix-turn-helix domain-containing protein [Pseudooceanicola sp. HF7]
MSARALAPVRPTTETELAPRPLAYVSARTLAELLDCSESTVRDMTRRGILPAPVRISGITRWVWSDVVIAISPRPDRAGQPDDDPILRASRGS